MDEENHLAERRKRHRFRPQDYVFASLHPQCHVLGRVVDISMDGLAFCYPAHKKQTDESSSLTISWGDGHGGIKRIPFRIVWDTVLPNNASLGAMVRHCGVRFVGLTNDQRNHLKHLVRDWKEPDV